jgi:hypothetical protein
MDRWTKRVAVGWLPIQGCTRRKTRGEKKKKKKEKKKKERKGSSVWLPVVSTRDSLKEGRVWELWEFGRVPPKSEGLGSHDLGWTGLEGGVLSIVLQKEPGRQCCQGPERLKLAGVTQWLDGTMG